MKLHTPFAVSAIVLISLFSQGIAIGQSAPAQMSAQKVDARKLMDGQ